MRTSRGVGPLDPGSRMDDGLNSSRPRVKNENEPGCWLCRPQVENENKRVNIDVADAD